MRRARGAIVALLVASLLALSPILPLADGAATDPSTLDTGAIRVNLPSPIPKLTLSADRSQDALANLSLDRIVELRTSPSDGNAGPAVVAVAFPVGIRSYNLSTGPSGALVFALEANLTVYRSNGILFPSRNVLGPQAPLTPIAPTTLQITVRSSGGSDRIGLLLQISGWPWVGTGDLLALSWGLSVSQPTGFAGCPDPLTDAVASTPCGPDPFAGGPSEWAAPLGAMEGLGRGGPVAELGWSSNASSPGATAIGTATAPGSSAEVVLAYPHSESGTVAFSLTYALWIPPAVPTVLKGIANAYLGGALASGILGGLALLAARRRELRLLDTL